MQELTRDLVRNSMSATPWDLGNEVLYRLCATHSQHTDISAIVAKVLMIGRVYAAAIERRKRGFPDYRVDGG